MSPHSRPLPQAAKDWVLGLDIGSASIGWSLIDQASQRVAAAGVRIFEAGADERGFAEGKEGSSNNTARRAARLHRRQLRRRAGRHRELFLELQRAGLLPAAEEGGRAGGSAARHAVLSRLDDALRPEWFERAAAAGVPAPEQVWPYFMRAWALDQPLPPFALGRVLYQLAQRRGFKSNRREAAGGATSKQAAADEKSTVKQGIATLQQEMTAIGARSLGEYYSRIDPSAVPLRRRWTHREMYRSEFALIWQNQAATEARLAPELKETLERLLFFQRKLLPAKPGKCELEPDHPRAPAAALAAQRFRLLQKVNDLAVVLPSLEYKPLTADERHNLLLALEGEGDLKFTEIRRRRLVDCPRGAHFNLESGGETKMPGNRTAAALRLIFGERWGALADGQRESVVALWLAAEIEDDELARIGREQYGLDDAAANAWAQAEPEPGYAKLSARALARLLPLMEQGAPFKTAEKEIYGSGYSGGTAYDRLRPVADALPEVANPAVMRALTELRKLVNALVREYGKPGEIRIELARDLKRNAQQRAALAKNTRQRESERKAAKKAIEGLTEVNIPAPSAADITKRLLWERCGKACPYCGGVIGFAELFGGAADVEHILPRSRFPDDSFGNKCIAHRGCNAEKGGRTPFEAFSGDPERWAQMLERVRRWNDEGKLKAFQAGADELDPDREGSFAARRLNDTRYTTTLAARYLGQLYGGRDVARPDGTLRRVVFASSGLVTATLRRGWGLEGILRQPDASENGRSPGKNRDDHRHHAVDAVVVALSSNAAIQQLSRAAAASASATGVERISSRTLQGPWPDFVDRVRPAIDAINVSHRPQRKLAGELHQESNYSRPHLLGAVGFVHIRKPVHRLSAAQINAGDKIVDPAVRQAVQAKLAALGGEPKRLEHDSPVLLTRAGRSVPIRSVRIRAEKAASSRSIGTAERQRQVLLAGNHHLELFEGRDRRGRDAWKGQVVTRLEANARRARCRCGRGRSCDCVVTRRLEHEEGFQFLYSLMGGDMVEMSEPGGAACRFVVRTISAYASGQIELALVAATNAAKLADARAAGQLLRITDMNDLRKRGCRKIEVDLLGRARGAGG